MKTKTVLTTVILLFSFLSAEAAFGKNEKLSDLEKLNSVSYKKVFMESVIDADSISKVFDAQPENDYEQFKLKLAPDAGTALTKRYKAAPPRINSKPPKAERPRLKDFRFFGSDKKEL
jgi:hypothetical protein